MIPAVALNREVGAKLRWVPHGFGMGAGIAAAGLAAIAAMWLVFSPTEIEVLQAAVSSHDFSTAQSHVASAARDGGAGALALAVHARMDGGDTAGALGLLSAPAVGEDGQDARLRRRLRIMVLRKAQRLPDLQAELAAIAAQTSRVADLRAVLAVATVRHDVDGERTTLASLAARKVATVAERERLATLYAATGERDAARATMRGLLQEGQPISAAGVAMLLAQTWPSAEPAEILQTLATLGPRAPALPQAIDALLAAGRLATAVDLAEAAARSQPLALVVQRCELLRTAGRRAEAQALLGRAIAGPPGTIASGDIVRLSFELDAVDALFTAVETGRITHLPPKLGLDLARRAVGAGRLSVLPPLDRVATGWRDIDPWFAMRLARQAGDTDGALGYARRLGAAAYGAQEEILRESGDSAGLRRLWLAEADRSDPKRRAALADELLASGDNADSIALLRRAAATAAPDSPEVAQLAYLWGPRPPEDALTWMKLRAQQAATPEGHLAWIRFYAQRDKPAGALATMLADAAADATPMRLLELELAEAAGDSGARRRIVANLLDGRRLEPSELNQLYSLLPGDALPVSRIEVERRLVAADLGTPPMNLDLAWDAVNRHQPAAARAPLAAYLAARPRDADAIVLMAEIERRAGNRAAERNDLARALALIGAAPADRDEVALRARILERLGQQSTALATVVALRRQRPDDDQLKAQNARLLIATGHPSAALKLLRGDPS